MRSADGDLVPKPLQMVGPRPLLWHVMRYHAHYGHKEFILCLGYGPDHDQEFLPQLPRKGVQRLRHARGAGRAARSDMSDWTITFVDTGLESPIGERLRRVRKYLGGHPYFLANYADVLTDAPAWTA